jgi:hypothetical protein
VTGQDKAEGQIRCVPDADSDRHQRLLGCTAVVADLKDGCGSGEIETVMHWASKAESLAEAAGAGGKKPVRRVRGKAAICGHQIQSGDRLKCAKKNTASEALGLAANVHAEVHAIDSVEVGVTGGAEEDGIARGWSAMRVGGWIGLGVVRAKISLDLDDATCN